MTTIDTLRRAYQAAPDGSAERERIATEIASTTWCEGCGRPAAERWGYWCDPCGEWEHAGREAEEAWMDDHGLIYVGDVVV